MLYLKIALIAFGAISLITLILYGVDKIKAKLGAWRISEKVLLSFSFFGGGLGGVIAMLLFRHKTRHWYFVAVNLLGLILQVTVLVYLLLPLIKG